MCLLRRIRYVKHRIVKITKCHNSCNTDALAPDFLQRMHWVSLWENKFSGFPTRSHTKIRFSHDAAPLSNGTGVVQIWTITDGSFLSCNKKLWNGTDSQNDGPRRGIWASLWENRSLGFPTKSDTNRFVQPQKLAGSLKFQIKKVEGSYYPYSESQCADQLRSWSASLFSHMQKAGFLITRLINRLLTIYPLKVYFADGMIFFHHKIFFIYLLYVCNIRIWFYKK